MHLLRNTLLSADHLDKKFFSFTAYSLNNANLRVKKRAGRLSTRINDLQNAGYNILVDNLPALYFLLKFRVCWEKISRCEERFLTWKAKYPHLLLREQCIDRERSEDTLPNLLRNVNANAFARAFPRFCYKLSTGWGKADPALRCNNKCGYERFFIRYFLLPRYFSPQQLQILYLFHTNFKLF